MTEEIRPDQLFGGRYEIRLSGSGGQGLILAGIILAEAAGLYDGRFVTQTQSYGPEARGGVSRSDVVISDQEIDYPKALQLDLLLAMNQRSCDAYFQDLKHGGVLLVDSTFVSEIPPGQAVAIPFTRIARDDLGREVVANIVSLGALAVFCPVVSRGGMEKAVLGRVPEGTEDLNLHALEAGVKAAERCREGMKDRGAARHLNLEED
jgi:2-oxoglutarate ferredoxin oxidoreductase subunit gamma